MANRLISVLCQLCQLQNGRDFIRGEMAKLAIKSAVAA